MLFVIKWRSLTALHNPIGLLFSIDEFDADVDFGDQLSTLQKQKIFASFGNKFESQSVLILGRFCSWKEEPPRKIEYYEIKEFSN